jgi:cytidyltransferase-related domain
MKQYKTGFICGFFDIIHEGHINILKWAKSNCETLIVAVGTDEFMLQRKNHKSVLTYEQRVEILKAIRYVDIVVEETDLDKLSAHKKYGFDVMFAGSDHEKEPVYIHAASELKKVGVDTLYFKRNNISSTSLRLRAAQV